MNLRLIGTVVINEETKELAEKKLSDVIKDLNDKGDSYIIKPNKSNHNCGYVVEVFSNSDIDSESGVENNNKDGHISSYLVSEESSKNIIDALYRIYERMYEFIDPEIKDDYEPEEFVDASLNSIDNTVLVLESIVEAFVRKNLTEQDRIVDDMYNLIDLSYRDFVLVSYNDFAKFDIDKKKEYLYSIITKAQNTSKYSHLKNFEIFRDIIYNA